MANGNGHIGFEGDKRRNGHAKQPAAAKKSAQHDAELESLRARVAEQEAQLEAFAKAELCRTMLECAPTNVMYADSDGIIRYVNKASVATLKRIEHLLPIRADAIVGANIDVFHKNPSHQRRLLADDRNLPHRAVITLGTEKLSLLASAVYDKNGKYIGVMQSWDVVTTAAEEAANAKGQLAAIDRVQAVIEFELDGTIKTANANFLSTLGYSLSEIQGKHHSMFVDHAERSAPAYREFWAQLNRGEFVAGEFRRVAKGGSDVWIQASYNPILDAQGKPYKVVKYATDITEQVKARALMNQVLKGVAANAVTLTSSSEELSAVSQQMSANAEETAVQANTVSAAAEQVSRNVQTVAAGTEEMSVSIREIAKNAAEAARVASSAVSVAASTNAMVAKLGESSDEIGKVIKVITSIAQQTKLLALNATIEAARAGEAGKGFAVVANEVKELAKETAKATEDISLKISAIQSDTTGAVAAIGQISNIINQINDIQNTIASAVEEQTATTNEMSRNVAESAKGVDEIAKNVTGVAKAAQDTTAGAASSLQAARSLSGMAVDLEKLVGQFNSSKA